MGVVTAALYEKLAGDSALVSLLGEYQGQPAIFTTDPAPKDAVLPYVVMAGNVAVSPFDTKTTQGQRIIKDVRCYASQGGTATTIENITKEVRRILHRQQLSVSGFDHVFMLCDGPSAADELDAYGQIITITLVIQES